MSRKPKVRSYTGKSITVTYDARRCIHAAECVHGLPAVFDTEKRPWIQPDGATPDEVEQVVIQCPTGALKFERVDGGATEPVPVANTILPMPDGPLYIHGDIDITVGGEQTKETRVALCRCGASQSKPFCDNSHQGIHFNADGQVTDNSAEDADIEQGGPLEVALAANGPYLLHGNFEIRGSDGRSIFHGERVALCRCGASENKPFCDGMHSKIDFSDD